MRRVEATLVIVFCVLLAGTVMIMPPVIGAQQTSRVARIGLLCATRCEGPARDALNARHAVGRAFATEAPCVR